MITLLIILQVLDVATTWYALEKAGLAEGNPIARWFIEKLGLIPGLLVLKGGFAAFLWIYGASELGLQLVCALYVLVVLNNAYLIYRSKKR